MRTNLLLLTLVLAGCGSATIGDPIDDDGPAANQITGNRQSMASCPNGGNVSPETPSFSAPVDTFAKYDGQSDCISTEQPGPQAFRELILATYPCTSDGGITRSCSQGGTSEHKEGRAWDWMIDYPHPAADALLAWLTANDGEHARRVGIMYMIWNRKIWKAYKSGVWSSYTGSNPHTDHVHFTFSWAGARKETTFWSAAGPTVPTEPTEPTAPDAGVPEPTADAGAPEPDLEPAPADAGVPKPDVSKPKPDASKPKPDLTPPLEPDSGELKGTPEPSDPTPIPPQSPQTGTSGGMLDGSCSLAGGSAQGGLALVLALLAGLVLGGRASRRRPR